MQSIINFFKNEPVYPFLLGAYPVLILWQVNYTQINIPPVLNTLGLSILVSCLFYFCLRLVLRQKHKAAVISGILILFFNSYGHLFKVVDSLKIFGLLVGRHRYFLPLWIALALFLVLVTIRSHKKMESITRIINPSAGLLTLLVLVQIIWISLQFQFPAKTQSANLSTAAASNFPDQQSPDVYYLMVDSYSREDVLREYFDLDNSQFITNLESLGFVVPDCSLSNYQNTALTMSSVLNMNYLSQLGIPDEKFLKIRAAESNPDLYQLDQNNEVMKVFRSLGYKIVAVYSLFSNLNFRSADVYYDFFSGTNAGSSSEALNFRSFYLQTTMMEGIYELVKASPALTKKIPSPLLKIFFPEMVMASTAHYQEYLQSVYQLDTLVKIPLDVPEKKFVFVHLLVSHHPFNFKLDGSYRWPRDDSEEAYREQILFLNDRLLKIIQNILKNSAVPPVIIIQSDHNIKFGEIRLRNFNAYYLPGGVDKQVYKEITPVNTFRLIFNSYFNLNYPLLKDQSFYLDNLENEPGKIVPVPITCANAGK